MTAGSLDFGFLDPGMVKIELRRRPFINYLLYELL